MDLKEEIKQALRHAETNAIVDLIASRKSTIKSILLAFDGHEIDEENLQTIAGHIADIHELIKVRDRIQKDEPAEDPEPEEDQKPKKYKNK